MPEFNDIVSSDIFGTGTSMPSPRQETPTLPEYHVPVRTGEMDRFNNGSKETNPLGDWLNKLDVAPSPIEQQMKPISFDGSKLQVERYKSSPNFQKLGLSFDDSNEERYGLNQTWGQVMGNGFIGMRKLAADGFTDNWAGFGRMFDALAHWDWSKLHGDAESMAQIGRASCRERV